MLGARAFLSALLLSLIVLQCTSAATPAPKEAQKSPAPAPASTAPQAKLANSNAGASKQQYQGPSERSYGAEEPYPDRSMKRGEYKDRPYADQRSGEGYSKYGRPQEGSKPYPKPADSYGPDYGSRGSYDGPKDAYDEPRDAYDSDSKEDGYGEPKPKPAPCPKAKTADNVENVLLSSASFKWSELAWQSAQTARNSRKFQTRAARKASTGPEDVSLDEPATDAAAKANIASVGVASVKAAGKDSAVRTAAAIPSYGRDPGMYDPASLLDVAPEISGKGATGTYSDMMVPTAEALAVGPHVGEHANPTFATVLHAVNAVAEIFFMSKKSGMAIKTASFRTSKLTSTKLDLVNIAKVTNPDAGNLTHGDPSAFFDVEAERWVLSWSSYPGGDSSVAASLYVAVSHSVDPLEYWTVYSLAAKPLIAPGMRFCENSHNRFSPMAPQISFSKDGIFISIGAYCETATNPDGKSFYPDTDPGIMSTLFAYSKAALYDCENNDTGRKIYAATYLGPFAWKSSISYKEQSLIKEEYRTFNNLITPARPQDEEDIKDAPLFVMKVDGAYMSVATLTDEPLAAMDCIENAPSIRAVIIGKGEDFSNAEGRTEGAAIMPQPDSTVTLDAGDCGMLGGRYGIRTYGSIHHRGHLYTTMCEFFGKDELRMPSIYWAIISTHPGSGLCKAARKKWGFIASADGLALAYPVIAARKDGSALVVYAFSGANDLPHGLGAANPGVASSVVGLKHGYGYEQGPTIDIVKLGEAAIQQCDEAHDEECIARWGDYSASQVYGGHMWFAVPYSGEQHGDFRAQWRSWIAVESLKMPAEESYQDGRG